MCVLGSLVPTATDPFGARRDHGDCEKPWGKVSDALDDVKSRAEEIKPWKESDLDTTALEAELGGLQAMLRRAHQLCRGCIDETLGADPRCMPGEKRCSLGGVPKVGPANSNISPKDIDDFAEGVGNSLGAASVLNFDSGAASATASVNAFAGGVINIVDNLPTAIGEGSRTNPVAIAQDAITAAALKRQRVAIWVKINVEECDGGSWGDKKEVVYKHTVGSPAFLSGLKGKHFGEAVEAALTANCGRP